MTVKRFNRRRIVQLFLGRSYGAAARMAAAEGCFDFYLFLNRWYF